MMMMQLWHVTVPKPGNVHWVGIASNREIAKQYAHEWFGYADPDKYIVTPLTNPGERWKVEVFQV
jgi:hypothetical protein